MDWLHNLPYIPKLHQYPLLRSPTLYTVLTLRHLYLPLTLHPIHLTLYPYILYIPYILIPPIPLPYLFLFSTPKTSSNPMLNNSSIHHISYSLSFFLHSKLPFTLYPYFSPTFPLQYPYSTISLIIHTLYPTDLRLLPLS